MAVAWALHQTCHFTLGSKKLKVLVDQEPIKNPSIQSLKQKILCWRFGMEHVAGKDHHVAVAMFPFPLEKPEGSK